MSKHICLLLFITLILINCSLCGIVDYEEKKRKHSSHSSSTSAMTMENVPMPIDIGAIRFKFGEAGTFVPQSFYFFTSKPAIIEV